VKTANMRILTLLCLLGLLSGAGAPALAQPNVESASKAKNTQRDFQTFMQPGNAIRVIAYPDTAGFPNGVYPIEDDGTIYLPIIGAISVEEYSATKLKEMLISYYIDYLPHPNLEVEPMIRVTLSGGFAYPGFIWVSPHKSLWEVMKLGGSLQRADGLEKLSWYRDEQKMHKDLSVQVASGHSLLELGVESGDEFRATLRPARSAWEIFTQDALPAIGVILSSLASAATTYILLQDIR